MTASRELTVLRDLLTQIRGLPPLANGVSALLALSANDPALVEKVTQIIDADPALATQVLKIANSAAFTGQTTIDSVERAIMRVGVRMVTGTVAQSQLQKVFDPNDPVMNTLWVSNVTAANLAMQLAARRPEMGVVPETAYTYALLHDIGRLLIAHLLGDGIRELLRETPHPRHDLSLRERALFGLDHETAGRLIGSHWKLPADITLVIAGHHLPPAKREVFPPHVNTIIALIEVVDDVTHEILLFDGRRTEIERRLAYLCESGELKPSLQPLGLTTADVVTAVPPTLAAVDRQRQLMAGR